MLKFIFAATLLLCIPCHAETLASWNFEGRDGTQPEGFPESVSDDIEVSSITRGEGFQPPARSTHFTKDGMAFVGSASTLDEAIENEVYFEFTITPKTGKKVDIGSLNFSSKRASKLSGPNHFVVRTSLDNFSENYAGPYDTQSAPVSEISDLTVEFNSLLKAIDTPVTFRFYAYGRKNPDGDDRGIWVIFNHSAQKGMSLSSK